MSLNKVIIQGRLVADPELRSTPTGVSVATFRIAVDRDFKNKDGEKEADFVTVQAWRGTAEFVSKYFQKGRMALVDGRLQMRNYTDKDGNKRTAAEVVAENIYFCDSKREEDPLNGLMQNMGGTSYNAESYGTQPTDNFAELSENEDSLPF